MITEMTAEQDGQIDRWRNDWFTVTTCTAPAERSVAEAVIAGMYRSTGFKMPSFVWLPSPVSAVTEFRKTRDVDQAVRREIEIHFSECLVGNLWIAVADAVDSDILVRLRVGIGDSPWEDVWRDVLLTGGSQLIWDLFLSGQHMSNWIPYYLFTRDVLGVEYKSELSRILDLWSRLARSTGWWMPLRDKVLCCERPPVQRHDGRKIGHCNDGPAIQYADGWSIWMLDGCVVDEQLVMRPEAQSIDYIRCDRNAEVKRIRIERYAGKDKSPADGWRKYLGEIGAKCIARRRNDIENVNEALMRTSDGETVLVCACPSTARVYALEVPARCSTVEQAQAYLHSQSGLDEIGKANVIGRS